MSMDYLQLGGKCLWSKVSSSNLGFIFKFPGDRYAWHPRRLYFFAANDLSRTPRLRCLICASLLKFVVWVFGGVDGLFAFAD